MITVVIDKRDANADDLTAFNSSAECQELVNVLINCGRKWGVKTQVFESGSSRAPDAAVKATKFSLDMDVNHPLIRKRAKMIMIIALVVAVISVLGLSNYLPGVTQIPRFVFISTLFISFPIGMFAFYFS